MIMKTKLSLIMKQITIIIVVFTGYIAALYGQGDVILDKIVNNITEQLLIFPQEKIYLQTDRPYYISGEKIFFRAFLLDAFTHKQDTLSRYVYVELINPADSVAQRVKIRRDSTALFCGAIPLPEDLPQGDYKIRAYTQYMRNQDESSFFSKLVRISDPQVLSIQLQTDFQWAENGNINTRLRFVDAKTQELINPQSVTLRLNQEESFTRKPDKDGWIRVQLKVPAEAFKRTLYVEFATNRNVFKQYIHMPYPEGDFDVSFYPEGGHLITGQPSNVAFKAINTHGASLNIKGEVVDSKGNIVAEFNTAHDGMGEFLITPLPDEHYQAVCHYENRTLQFDLPKAQPDAVALKVVIHGNKLRIMINKPESASLPSFYLIIHSRGLVYYAEMWDTGKDYITFDTSVFPSGVNHILLLTKDIQIVSERLVFLLNNDQGIASFQTQKNTYRKREQVKSNVQLKNADQQALKGNFSITVTSDKEVIPDTTSSILSCILLRSELKGHIENPEYYFQKGNKDAELAADLLMKTHGWTRYALPDVIRGELAYPGIPFETSQQFSGVVKSGLLSKPATNAGILLTALNYHFLDKTEADQNGRYVFRNFEFPDSTKYIIQAINSKGKSGSTIELFVDEDTFPGIYISWTAPMVEKATSNSVFMDYVAKADQHYIFEHGVRVIDLPEVQIKAVRKDEPKYKSIYNIEPNYSFSENEIQHVSEVKTLLYQVAGVMVSGNSIRIRGASGPPLIVIDDVPFPKIGNNDPDLTTIEILNMFSINDIGQIDILKDISNTAVYGNLGGDGVILIYTKKGEGKSSRPLFNIKPVMPLGYQLPIEFYSPKYDTQESIDNPNPDLRTTIYWQPNVITDDEGNALLDFYTADDPGTYSVIIEGVSDDGRLIHYWGKSLIKVE